MSPTRREWRDALWDEKAGPSTSTMQHVLLAVERHIGPRGCFPGIARLARMTRYGESTVRRTLEQAEEEGWIIRHPRGRGYEYEPQIPLRASAVSGDDTAQSERSRSVETQPEKRSERAESSQNRTPLGASTALGASAEYRSERAPNPVVEPVGGSIPAPTSSASSTFTPTSESARDGGKVESERMNFTELRAALVEHALLGHEEVTTQHGEKLGIGLLVNQAKRILERGVDPELLATMVRLVRADEEGPGRDEPFSLQWFEAEPARWSRLEGQALKAVG